MPKIDKSEENTGFKDNDGETGEVKRILSVDAGGVSAISGKSEYERTHEANIAENRALLHELGLQFGWDNETDKVGEKKAAKKPRNEKKKQAQSRVSPRNGPR